MKKKLKIIFSIILWVFTIVLLFEVIESFKGLDPWGLSFTFYTLPISILCIITFVSAIGLTKDIIRKW